MTTPTTKALISLLLITLAASSCLHDQMAHEPTKVHENKLHARHGRTLEEGGSEPIFEEFRIMADYSPLTYAPVAVSEYIQYKLFPAALDYFKAALKVERLEKLIYTEGNETICDVRVDDKYFNEGVDADLVIIVTGSVAFESYIAWARTCNVDEDTYRPVFGQINFNFDHISPDDPSAFESDLATVLHEMAHVFGFSSWLFPHFLMPTEVGQVEINGIEQYYISSEPITSRIRNHFGCDTIPGALLENQGGSGSAGSHFERRVFMNEMMTASEIADARLSEFTLAVFESTGWYEVNYDMAEPFYWGKDKGCAFYMEACYDKNTSTPNFEEFCSPLAEYGCSYHGRFQAYCGTPYTGMTDPFLNENFDYFNNNTRMADVFGDNCPYFVEYSASDCADPAAERFALMENHEHYGKGSKCFMGNLFPNSAGMSRDFAYCFQYECEKQADDTYILSVMMGDLVGRCTEEGRISVEGMGGLLQCPNPTEYCTTIGKTFCPRGCMGRGQCLDTGVCECNQGFEGDDCSHEVAVAEEDVVVEEEEDVPPVEEEEDVIVEEEEEDVPPVEEEEDAPPVEEEEDVPPVEEEEDVPPVEEEDDIPPVEEEEDAPPTEEEDAPPTEEEEDNSNDTGSNGNSTDTNNNSTNSTSGGKSIEFEGGVKINATANCTFFCSSAAMTNPSSILIALLAIIGALLH